MAPKRASKNKENVELQTRNRRRVQHESPPQSPLQEEEDVGGAMAEEVRRVGGGGTKIRAGMYLDEGEIKAVTGNLLFQFLDEAQLSTFTTFTSNWYPAIVYKFYESVRLRYNDSVGVLGCRYNIDGVTGIITETDLINTFGMISRGADDYPERGWCTNWPVTLQECVQELNNNRRVKKEGIVYKTNLNGIQKLVWKVVSSILLPSTSQASEISCLHSFVIWSILNLQWVNMPRLIIKHMFHQRAKSTLQYGMIISHLLVNIKGVPIGECRWVDFKKDSKMGRQSLISQEVFMWEGVLRSKWEVFEHLADVQDEVWRFNNCLPPKGWVPPTLLANIDEATEHGEAGSSSFSGSSDRAMSMLESINANMLRLLTDNESIKVDMGQLRVQQERMIVEQERMSVEQERMRVEQERMRIQFERMFPPS